MKRFLPFILIAIAIGSFVAYRYFSKPSFRYAGTLETTRIDLPARVATVVDTIAVQEGARIVQGQKLATLSCEELRIAGRLADDNYSRGVILRKGGSIAQETFDQLLTKKKDSDARLRWCDIVTPVKGKVLTRFVEPGEWVNPGAKILTVADLSDIWAYIYVPQAVMSQLKTGMNVTGIIPELGDRKFSGVIRKINDEAEFTPKNVQTQAERTRLVFGVKVAFENSDDTLKPGMTMEISL